MVRKQNPTKTYQRPTVDDEHAKVLASLKNKIKLRLVRGDLIAIKTGIVVNAANTSSRGLVATKWSGVAGAIYNQISSTERSILTSDWDSRGAKIKPGTAVLVEYQHVPYKFQSLGGKYLIHAGSPRVSQDKDDLDASQVAQLENAYYEAMKLSLTLYHQDVENAALPALGTGIYGVKGDVSANALIAAYTRIKNENEDTFPGTFDFYCTILGTNIPTFTTAMKAYNAGNQGIQFWSHDELRHFRTYQPPQPPPPQPVQQQHRYILITHATTVSTIN
jgi:O-acetyl-ADP-ribose deacetylase (regulator of RNase III)